MSERVTLESPDTGRLGERVDVDACSPPVQFTVAKLMKSQGLGQLISAMEFGNEYEAQGHRTIYGAA
jgi:hypothetical protein